MLFDRLGFYCLALGTLFCFNHLAQKKRAYLHAQTNLELVSLDFKNIEDSYFFLVGKKIDINRASIQALKQLPSISTTIAQRIISYRQKKEFKSLKDVLAVKGLGPKKLQKIRPYLQLNN